MKGLLIKDFKLLKMQKNFFVVMIVISVGARAVFRGSVLPDWIFHICIFLVLLKLDQL